MKTKKNKTTTTYRVHGTISVSINMRVEADSKEDAIEKAYEQWPGMSNWVGNGKCGGAMCGPHQDSETDANVDADCAEPEFDDAEIEEAD